MPDHDSGHLFGPASRGGKKTGRRRKGPVGGMLTPLSQSEIEQLEQAAAATAAGDQAGAQAALQRPVYVDLAVDVQSDPEQTFTYLWLPRLGAVPSPGTPLLVQYGPGRGALRIGWLIGARTLENPPPPFSSTGRKLRYRPVLEKIGDDGLLPPDLIDLARFLSRYYRAPLGECITAMVPPPVIHRTERQEIFRLALKQIAYDDLPTTIAGLGKRKRAQAAVLQALQFAREPLTRKELIALCKERGAGGGSTAINGLLKAGLLAELAETAPDPWHLPGLGGSATPWSLTEDQAAAFAILRPVLMQRVFAPFLLHGVTGSGKTEVYLHAIDVCLKQNRSALVLVPEITLTPQTLARIRQRAGDCVVTFHSHLTEGVRADHWRQARDGRASVVVGARSAVFAPLKDIGLIVVDEEHETTYKQENSPRYNGRDIAVLRAQKCNAVVLMGSATPSLASYHAAQTGRYTMLTLPRRVGTATLPKVQLIDTNTVERAAPLAVAAVPMALAPDEEENSGAYGDEALPAVAAMGAFGAASAPTLLEPSLTPPLSRALRDALAENHQAILFVNRRGQHPVRHCRRCGWVDRCEHCDQVMTFHRVGGRNETDAAAAADTPRGFRVCHLCGTRGEGAAAICPVCHSPELHFLGAGTQRVEEELAISFPQAKVARLDSDVTQNRSALLGVLTGLMTGEIQILVGTQMVAKGLDFPNVTLVGIIDADSSLRQCDYQGAERTFQLISQVTGRA
ncbi:MAG TPA: primosomal protein N', partial [Planctomycetota bacterium]|nr:primosomal protein N' [Planctomycetota bacterium]